MGPKAKVKNRNPVMEVAKGVLLALMLAVISAGLYAILIQRQTVSETSVGIWGGLTLGVAALVGCLLTAGRMGQKRLVFSLITGAVFAFILLAVGILFFDGPFNSMGWNLVAILVGTAISCIKAMKNPSKKMKFKIHSR